MKRFYFEKIFQNTINKLSNLSYNRKFNIFYNILTIISILYVLLLTIKEVYFFKFYPIAFFFFIDIIFLILFSFELLVKYLSIGDFRKFFKVYFWDLIALFGWIPINYIILQFFYDINNESIYLHDLALLRLIRIIRLITIFKIFGILEKEFNFFKYNKNIFYNSFSNIFKFYYT